MSRQDKSTTGAIPLPVQRDAWNHWNTDFRESAIDVMAEKQLATVTRWLRQFHDEHGFHQLRILDAGCGTGWLCERLLRFGRVTGVDLADEVIARAQQRIPTATLIAGDFMEIDLPTGYFDVITCFELLAHVADQPALIERLAELLKPGGVLMISTQNRRVLERCSWVGQALPGTLRRWLDLPQLKALLSPHFEIEAVTSVHPQGNQGWLRLVNSRWLARPLDRITLGAYTRLREQALLGWSLMIRCRRRAS